MKSIPEERGYISGFDEQEPDITPHDIGELLLLIVLFPVAIVFLLGLVAWAFLAKTGMFGPDQAA